MRAPWIEGALAYRVERETVYFIVQAEGRWCACVIVGGARADLVGGPFETRAEAEGACEAHIRDPQTPSPLEA